ncbi:CDP-diacylglycerol pyrophosphatase [compost metagenome]
MGANWAPFPVEILGHKVFARRLSAEQIQKQDAFKYLANDFVEAKDNMYQYGLAMVQVKNSKGASDFILMTMLGHAEDIQDHSCPQMAAK